MRKPQSRRKDKSRQPKNQAEMDQISKQSQEIAAAATRRAIEEMAKQTTEGLLNPTAPMPANPSGLFSPTHARSSGASF